MPRLKIREMKGVSSVKCELFYFICVFYLSGWSGSSCSHGPFYFPLQIKEDQSKAFREGGGVGSLRGDKMGGLISITARGLTVMDRWLQQTLV